MPSVSRSSKLPERERGVCRRLKQLRESLGLSQRDFAAQLQISRERLASYETFRAPLKFGVGMLACVEFDVSETWLATGSGKIHPLDKYPLDYSMMAKADANFSWGYDNVIRLPLGLRPKWDEKLAAADAQKSKELLRSALQFWEKTVPDKDWGVFANYMWEKGESFRESTWRALMELKERKARPLKPVSEISMEEALQEL